MKSVLEKASKNTELLKFRICREFINISKRRKTDSSFINISLQIIRPESLDVNNQDRKEAITYNGESQTEQIVFCVNDQDTTKVIPFFMKKMMHDLATVKVETIVDNSKRSIAFKIKSDNKEVLESHQLTLK